MTVFIGSTVKGLEGFRDAAAKAAMLLKHDVIWAEALGASVDSPQHVCLAGVRAADVTILLLGGRYGEPQGTQGLSPTHEEYREAREHGGVLAFVQEGVVREQRQEELIREVQAWSHGQFTSGFSDAEGLKDAVTAALHEFELIRKAGVLDEGEILARARRWSPNRGGGLRRASPRCSRGASPAGPPPWRARIERSRKINSAGGAFWQMARG